MSTFIVNLFGKPLGLPIWNKFIFLDFKVYKYFFDDNYYVNNKIKNMKNWIVISQPVKNGFKGLSEYTNYLVSENHSNHRMTEILPVHNNNKSFIGYCTGQALKRDLEREKNKKGGRPISSFAQSFVFSLPPGINIEVSQWNKIAKYLFKGLSQFLSIDIQTLKKATFINIHDQNNQHLNLLVSKVINGKVVREVQRKAINEYLKSRFNEAVLNYVKVDNRDYKPLTKRSTRYNSSFFKSNKDIIFDTTIVDLEYSHKETYPKKNLKEKIKSVKKRRLII